MTLDITLRFYSCKVPAQMLDLPPSRNLRALKSFNFLTNTNIHVSNEQLIFRYPIFPPLPYASLYSLLNALPITILLTSLVPAPIS